VVIFTELFECAGANACNGVTDCSSAIVVRLVNLISNLIIGLTSVAVLTQPVEPIYIRASKHSAQVQ